MSKKTGAVRKTVDLEAFRASVAAGNPTRSGVTMQMRLMAPQVVEGEEDSRVVSFVFSDTSVDRYGDTIDVKGWVFDGSEAGIVALFGHDTSDPENVIGRAHNIRVAGNELVGDIHFMEGSVNPRAETVFQMVKAGYLNTVSVGFDPIEWAPSKTRSGGIDFKRQELFEISVVPIPANRNAVVLAKAAGIDTDRLGLIEAAGERRTVSAAVTKSLYDVSEFADVVNWLAYVAQSAHYEAEYEGDGSDVPDRLVELLRTAGGILVDMTAEEVGEILQRLTGQTESKAAGVAFTKAMKAVPEVRAANASRNTSDIGAVVKSAIAEALAPAGQRAGKKVSAVNEKCLRDAHELISKASEMILSVAGANATEEAEQAEEETMDATKSAQQRRRRALALQRRAGLAIAA